MTCSSLLADFDFRPVAAFFEFVTFVNEQGHVAAIVDHQLRTFAARERDRLVGAPPIFLERLALPREDRHARLSRSRPPRDPAWRKYYSSPSAPAAPSATSVSISTAVWIVMWSEPVTRTPLQRLRGAYFLRIAINPGISFSAMSISRRPNRRV